MQSLEVISVNIWAILISLCNLLIIFLILKKFLFKPVKNILAERQADIDSQYDAANKAESDALESKKLYEEKLSYAKAEAQDIIDDASKIATTRGDALIKEAQSKANAILRTAEAEAELELKKAQADIKDEIISVSTALSEKMLNREINADDHKSLIDSFIDEIGEENVGD
jgi:F-type H+-transporting ATPase subunit b